MALIVGMSGDKVRVTNTAQVRIEQSLAAEAGRAAIDKSGALPHAAIRDAIAASGLDFTSDPDQGAAQQAAIYALGQGGALSLLTGVAGAGKTTLLSLGCSLEGRHPNGAETDALPLLLLHGWPGSVIEFRKLIGPLSNPAAMVQQARRPSIS